MKIISFSKLESLAKSNIVYSNSTGYLELQFPDNNLELHHFILDDMIAVCLVGQDIKRLTDILNLFDIIFTIRG